MTRPPHPFRSLLRLLLGDATANTIVISAVALIPLMAMVGGAVDASRYYMAASRLQSACDAGALAGRRAMTTTAFTTEQQSIAFSFFDNNFPEGIYETTNRTRSYSADANGVVMGTASAVMPATIMTAFGYTSFNLAATCSADVNISNTDIAFVLDVTGSMNCPDNNFSSCPNGNNNNVEASNSRVAALRNATLNFYDTVKASTSPNAQVRFGFVPYSHNVNVSQIIPRSFLAASHTYQSRRWINEPISNQPEWIPRDLNNLANPTTDQQRYVNNSDGTANTADRNLCETTYRGTFRLNDVVYEISGNTYTLGAFSGGSSTMRAGCRATVRRTRLTYHYEPRTFDVSGIRDGGTVTTDTGFQGASVTHSWNGCIEEAATVNTGIWNPLPAGAFDMNINLVPASEAQRWKPSLPNVVFRRTSNGAANGPATHLHPVITANELNPSLSYTCPAAARRLGDISRTELQTYLGGLAAIGATYHPMGMVWAGRIISPNGLFSADNTSAPNGDPIGRHVVFMTDGLSNETNVQTYNPWGMEFWDRRVTDAGDQTQSHDRHAARLQAVCDALKRENISVWVVVMNPTLTQNMIDCASPGKAFRASNSSELNAAFQQIAQQIAALRLTQ